MRVRVLMHQQQREARIFNSNIHNLLLHTKDAATAFHADPLLEESLKPGLLKKRFERHCACVLFLEELDTLRPMRGVLFPVMFLNVIHTKLCPVLGVLCPSTFPCSNFLLTRQRHITYVVVDLVVKHKNNVFSSGLKA